ncbi:HAD family hydrolase [Thermaerobacter sp. PB12/4term]|uniref:HAD family hydrolase n=1 Tax=Thermaerobacter sp. PB12/4term TaxID=2293838 RepID=UPI000E32A3EF|nr:HAD family hydrolase [Thermaerobacter sp. PB12/4term]QIA27788.1 HAD family hydrolase [Thermaerobacter sp. PB12/4term]
MADSRVEQEQPALQALARARRQAAGNMALVNVATIAQITASHRRTAPRAEGRRTRPPSPLATARGDGDKVRLVIFDLDGTLYDDLLYTTAYARALAARLPVQKRSPFLRDAFPLAPLNRRLRLGMIYDRETDTLLGHPLLAPGTACSWDGAVRRPWQPARPGGHVGAGDRYLTLGDAWTLITAAALRGGLTMEDCVAAMAETRSRVTLPPPESYHRHAFFGRGEEPVRVLVTNAGREHAENMLRHLGLEQAFTYRFSEAEKPRGWRRIIPLLERQTGIPRSAMVAIGDNLLNDILPVLEMGVRPLLIDRYGLFTRFRGPGWRCARSLEEALASLSTRFPVRSLVRARSRQRG